MADGQKWPQTIWIVRHGESAGNVARDAAVAAGLPTIDIGSRDVDVPLSDLGRQQAAALGHWFRQMPAEQQPTAVFTSPYLRACHTAEIVTEAAGLTPSLKGFVVDERLREKEFGILDRLTRVGIEQKFPEEAERYRVLGKFYYRPPGGESWCDVILRLRSLIGTLTRDYCEERVLIVGHQVVVHCLRYLMERMSEQQILDIDRQKDLANCSITAYQYDPGAGTSGRMTLKLFNFVAPLQEEGAPITRKPDVPLAAK